MVEFKSSGMFSIPAIGTSEGKLEGYEESTLGSFPCVRVVETTESAEIQAPSVVAWPIYRHSATSALIL